MDIWSQDRTKKNKQNTNIDNSKKKNIENGWK